MKNTLSKQNNYRGRFAPSPSGELHFGSLLAAMASYADARSHGGQWLLRIDDIDHPRVIKNSAQHIINTLEQCGFEWDKTITYQSQNINGYQQAMEQLNQSGLTYSCNCSRKQIKALSAKGIYPGTCRTRNISTTSESAVRLKVTTQNITFKDQIQQDYTQCLAQDVGDFVIFRRDQIFTYQLSVVVDDFLSKITHVIRGYDLIDSTPRQIYLQQKLCYPSLVYAHIPLAVTSKNIKLSKLSHADKIEISIATLVEAARFLNQEVLDHTEYERKDDFWQHLFKKWDINKVANMEKKQIKV